MLARWLAVWLTHRLLVLSCVFASQPPGAAVQKLQVTLKQHAHPTAPKHTAPPTPKPTPAPTPDSTMRPHFEGQLAWGAGDAAVAGGGSVDAGTSTATGKGCMHDRECNNRLCRGCSCRVQDRAPRGACVCARGYRGESCERAPPPASVAVAPGADRDDDDDESAGARNRARQGNANTARAGAEAEAARTAEAKEQAEEAKEEAKARAKPLAPTFARSYPLLPGPRRSQGGCDEFCYANPLIRHRHFAPKAGCFHCSCAKDKTEGGDRLVVSFVGQFTAPQGYTQVGDGRRRRRQHSLASQDDEVAGPC